MATKKTPNSRLGVTRQDSDQSINRQQLTKLERQARRESRQSIRVANYGGSAMGGFSGYGSSPSNVTDAHQQFYSPQLSTDFLELPQSEREKRELFRFWYTTHPIVGAAIDFHTDVPMSKIRLSLPKGKDRRRNKQILHFYEEMCRRVRMFQTLYDATHEYWLQGNCVPESTPIRTPSGYSKAGSLDVGDLVLTHHGRWRPIKAVSRRLSDSVLSFRCWKTDRSLDATGEHPVETVHDSSFRFSKASDILPGDFVRITWPTDVLDVPHVSLDAGPGIMRAVDGGYEVIRRYSHSRNPAASTARSGMLSWLSSLSSPVVRTRASLAGEFGVPVMTLNNVISQLGLELPPFHRRVGKPGFSGGSAVEWLPIGPVDTSDCDSYSYDRPFLFKSPLSLSVDPGFLYLVGYWLGDGTLGRDSSRDTWGRGLWQICFGSSSSRQKEKINDYLVKTFGADSVRSWSSDGMDCVRVISNPAFVEWWSSNFGSTSFGADRKKVPLWVLQLPPEKLSHVVAGLIDSDGCIGQTEKGHVTFAVCSRHISDFMRDASLRLGAVVNEFVRPPREVVLPGGEMTTSRHVYVIQCLEERSCSLLTVGCIKEAPSSQDYSGPSPYFVRIGNSIAFKVRSREELPGCPVVNFEVEEDNTFQVNGFSTHNCFIFAEDQDMLPEVPEELTMNISEEEVGDVDWAGRSSRRRVKKLEPKPPEEQHKAILDFVAKNYRGWEKLTILPPEQVKLEVFQYTNKTKMELIPSEKDRLVVLRAQNTSDPEAAKIAADIPDMIKDRLLNGQPIPLNTSPYQDYYCSSFCYHLAHKKAAYDDRGTSILERCLRTLLFQDKLRQAQTSIASRAMTPKRVVWGDKMSETDVEGIRDQIDQALQDPDFTVVANFELHWDEIGSRDRLLDLSTEYEITNKLLFIGLRITESMLTGETTYSGERIHLDVMNTMYLLYRETMAQFVEEQLFAPVAEKKQFFEIDEDGNRNLLYPKLQFTRLALRDNTELQDFMYNLYQKGSMPIAYIYDLLNIDVDDAHDQLQKDAFTLKDSNMNELIRAALTSIGDSLAEDTDVTDRVYVNLNLKKKGKNGDRFGGKGGDSSA